MYNSESVRKMLDLVKIKHGDNQALVAIANLFEEQRRYAMSIRRDPAEALRKIREASAGSSNDCIMIGCGNGIVSELMVELDQHRQLATIARVLASALTAVGEDID